MNVQDKFDEIVKKSAELVKYINEDYADDASSDKMNKKISDLTADLVDETNDFVSASELKRYVKNLIGKSYFEDGRCWDYLLDMIRDDVFSVMKNAIDESMQTGLGMAQQLPTNSVYDGEIDIIEKRAKGMNKKLTEKRGNEEDEKLALAKFLGDDVDEIENGYSDHVYEAHGKEYWVSDYDTAYDEAVEECEELFDDMGLEAVNEDTQEYFLENEEYCSYDWKSDMHESNLSYAEDIDSESGSNGYATRLVEEAIDRKVIKDKDCFENDDGELDYEDKDELAEMLASSMDEDYRSMSEWFESIYGRDWAREMADTLKKYIDYKKCAEYVVDIDGVEATIARYDGKYNEEKVNGVDYYIYRMN